MNERIVINATAIGRNVDGIGVYGTRLLQALARAPDRPPMTLVLNRDVAPHLADLERERDVSVWWAGSWVSPDRGPGGHLLRWLFAQAVAVRYPAALIFGVSQIEAVLRGGRSAVMVHDTIPMAFPQYHPRQRHFWRHVLSRAFSRQQAIAVPSYATKARLLARFRVAGARAVVIPHGVPVPIVPCAPENGPREPLVLWLGRIGPMKNLDVLIRAFHRMRPACRHTLVIAGSGDRRALLETTRGDDAVRVLGPVSDEEKLSLLDRAALLVCPSLDEGFGLPVLEAMARGCPVVASLRGSLPEVGGDAAVYADPDDAGHLAAQMQRVLDDGRLRSSLAALGLARASGFSWTASAHAHVALFERVLASPAGVPARPAPNAAPAARPARAHR